jgi:hypothetical protein
LEWGWSDELCLQSESMIFRHGFAQDSGSVGFGQYM